MDAGIRYCLEIFQVYYQQDRQCTFHVTLSRVRATIVTVEKQ